MNFIIRKAETSDFKQIVNLLHEFAEFEKHPERMTNSIERMMAEKEFFNCFVAETPDNKIVGYSTWFFAYFTWTGKSLYMDDLYVKPEYRGHGIGGRLINTVIGFARSSGCHKMHWQVSSWNNRAIEFYKRLGAEIDHTEMNCDLFLNP